MTITFKKHSQSSYSKVASESGYLKVDTTEAGKIPFIKKYDFDVKSMKMKVIHANKERS